MGSPLQAIMSLLQAPRPRQPVTVRPDYGLTGASVQAMQKSPYERTLRPGETRSREDLRDMLAEVILAAGSAAVPGMGPRGMARPAPASVSRRGLLGLRGNEREVVGYDWRSKVVDEMSGREGGLIGKRVSDWDRKGTSTGTGRDIVHVFKVRHPDGSITEEGINSAQNLLGISAEKLKSLATGERVLRDRANQAEVASGQAKAMDAASSRWFEFLSQYGSGATTAEQIQSLGGFGPARTKFKELTGAN